MKPETKADPFSLKSLIAWLEKQPADTGYNFFNCHGGCLLHQYVSSLGLPTNFENYMKAVRLDRGPNSDDVDGVIAFATPWTFGAALKRARKVQRG